MKVLSKFFLSIFLILGFYSTNIFAKSSWDQVKDSGEIRMAVFQYEPYFSKDPSTDKWDGSLVQMVREFAEDLNVDFKPVEVGGWSELVLSISTGKVDLACGMQATPKRATAIDFAGPVYWIEWAAVTRPGFEGGDSWADFNKPEIKIAVMTGTSDEKLVKKWAPKATRIDFKELSQIILAVSSGRADVFSTTVLSSLIAKQKNPGLGEFHVPRDAGGKSAALPGYCGIRYDADPRFKNFINWRAEWNNLMGYNEERMRKYFEKYSSVKELPDTISFSR